MSRKWCQVDPKLVAPNGRVVQVDTAILAEPADIVALMTQATALEVRFNPSTPFTRQEGDTEKDLAGRDFDIAYIPDTTVPTGAVKCRAKWFVNGTDPATGRQYSTSILSDPLAPSTGGSAGAYGKANAWTGNVQVTP